MNNFFYKKKIIITGSTGFKGSWLSLWLTYFGAKVMGLSLNPISTPSNFKVLKLKKKIIFKKIDIKKKHLLEKEIKKFKPDFIFHLAAEAIVKNAYENPLNAWETNSLGTINLIDSIKNIKTKLNVIIITSDKVYKNIETKKGSKENDTLGGHDPYSASKASADLACQSYYHSFLKHKKNLRICIARAGNVIGGGDWSENRVIPDCIKNWSKNKSVIIRNPNSTRPWQHVFDVLNGYLMLAIKLKKDKNINGQAFNFGPKIEKNLKVIHVVKKMQKRWGNAKWKIKKVSSFSENKLLYLNSNKAKKLLKWQSKLDLNATINYTADWYKEYYFNKKNILNFSILQIKKFEKLKNKKS